MISLLKTLCALPGASGCEEAVATFIRAYATPYADEIRTDAIGNIMVFRRGKKRLNGLTGSTRPTCARPVVLCAHMDEVGVIVKSITDDGMLKFGFVGGVDARVVLGRRIRFGNTSCGNTDGNDTVGVVEIKAVHLSTAAERKTMPKTKDLYIDIGASSAKAAKEKVPLGSYGVFDSAIVEFGDDLLQAKALDDRIGCAVLLKLLENPPPVDTWFCFTVQEETGLRGAASMAFALHPSIACVIEGTTAADLPEVKDGKTVCCLRGGVVLPFMDRRTIYDAGLFELLRNACNQRGIPWQTKTRVAGGTDAGRIQQSCDGVRVCAMAAPVRYIHSPVSVVAKQDCLLVQQAATAFLDQLAAIGE